MLAQDRSEVVWRQRQKRHIRDSRRSHNDFGGWVKYKYTVSCHSTTITEEAMTQRFKETRLIRWCSLLSTPWMRRRVERPGQSARFYNVKCSSRNLLPASGVNIIGLSQIQGACGELAYGYFPPAYRLALAVSLTEMVGDTEHKT